MAKKSIKTKKAKIKQLYVRCSHCRKKLKLENLEVIEESLLIGPWISRGYR